MRTTRPIRALAAHLRHHQAVPSQPHVVADLHQVVDLGAPLHDRVVDAAPIDAVLGADVHVVPDDAAPGMRQPLEAPRPGAYPNPVPPSTAPALDAGAVPDPGLADHPRPERSPRRSPRPRGPRPRVEPTRPRAARPRPAPRTRRRTRPSQDRPRRQSGGRVDPRHRLGLGVEGGLTRSHRAAGIAHQDGGRGPPLRRRSSATSTPPAREDWNSVGSGPEARNDRSPGPARSSGAMPESTAPPSPTRRPPRARRPRAPSGTRAHTVDQFVCLSRATTRGVMSSVLS